MLELETDYHESTQLITHPPFSRILNDKNANGEYICPITHESITQDTQDQFVLFIDDHAYNKKALFACLKLNPISPITRRTLADYAQQYQLEIPNLNPEIKSSPQPQQSVNRAFTGYEFISGLGCMGSLVGLIITNIKLDDKLKISLSLLFSSTFLLCLVGYLYARSRRPLLQVISRAVKIFTHKLSDDEQKHFEKNLRDFMIPFDFEKLGLTSTIRTPSF